MTRRARGRGGFTLVELLVVIAIIAILAAMTAGGVGRVRAAAIRAQAATEIAQLGSAIGAFKAKFNVDYLPATGPVTTGSAAQKFRLRSTYPNNTTSDPNKNSFEAKYLKSLFPQWDPVGTGSPANNGLTDLDLDHNQALVFFLSGGSVTNFTGFSPNRAAPFSSASLGSTEPRIGPFFEFPQSRINGSPPQYRDPWGTPYAYFSSGYDPGYGNPTGATPITATFSPGGSIGNISPLYRGHSTTPSRGRFEQAKSFQIISAGANQKFGPGGDWINQVTGRLTAYQPTKDGGDDIANFVGGTLGFAQ